MSGLFRRTVELLRGEGEIFFDSGSGFSAEEQKEILAKMDRDLEDDRIRVSPETREIRAQKRGTLFPLIVNVSALVLLAAGGLAFYLLFQQGDSGLREEVPTVATAEGRLIEELKKESEAQLVAKNQEIAQIQGRMAEIDRQRQELQTDMDARVNARERELRASLESELAVERERLRGQGISEGDITLRLQELEGRKTAQYQQELQAFRLQAEEERRQAEESLASLRLEYEQGLAQANQERSRVVEESRRREEELRRQLDSRTQALEQETLAARQQLDRIAEERKRETLASGQLVGFYDRLRTNLANNDFDQALSTLESIRQYLQDPQIAALPGMVQRREVELFVVDSITSLVRARMTKEEADTTSLIAAANTVADLRRRVLAGDDLYRQGRVEQAEASYREALALIPEVDRVHSYFLNRRQQGEGARAGQLRELLRQAGEAFAGGNYAETLEGYARALEYLPEEPATVRRLVDQIRESGLQLGLRSLRREQSAAAAATLGRADRLLAQGDPSAAIEAYLQLVQRFPNSEQLGAAVQGIGRAVAARGAVVAAEDVAKLQEAVDRKDAEIAALKAQLGGRAGDAAGLQEALEEKNAEIISLRAELEAARGGAGEQQQALQERLARMREELDGRVARMEQLQAEKTSMEQELASLRGELSRLRESQSEQAAPAAVSEERYAELVDKVRRLEAVQARYQRLVAGYQEYAAEEDAYLSSQGDQGLIDGKLRLNTFLASTQETFPGLWQRVKRYDEAFEEAGRASAVQQVGDVLYELSYIADPAERARYLEQESRRYPEDRVMQDFLKDLAALPSGAKASQETLSFNAYLDLLAASGRLDTRQASVLDELALRTTRESRELFLEVELLRAKDDSAMARLLQDLLALVRADQ